MSRTLSPSSAHEADQQPSSERTPLLPHDEESSGSSTQADADAGPTKKSRRVPSIIALALLCTAVVIALTAGFVVPATVEEYAKEAIVFDPQRVSIDSFTKEGVRARLQGVVYLDAAKVDKKSVRDIGKAATWIAREAQSGEAEVGVFLPGYDNTLLGRATVPPVKLNIRNGHRNYVDLLMDLRPGDITGIHRVAQDFIRGDLKDLDVQAVANIQVRSGLINLGQQSITQYLHFKQHDVPKVPSFDIAKLKVDQYGKPGQPSGMNATAVVAVKNSYPVKFDVPPVAVKILLPDCFSGYLPLGAAITDVIHVLPKQNINATVYGRMQQIPSALTKACPDSEKSPLDAFIGAYLKGEEATIYVTGDRQKDPRTPGWIGKMLQDTVFPVPVPSHPFDNMIKNFSLADVHLSLPVTPESSPKISATVKVTVALPKDLNFDVNVKRVRADADVFYGKKRLGKLDLRQWQNASSHKHNDDLLVQSKVVNAPLQITDNDVFSDLLQAMLWGHKGVQLGVKAKVDVDTATALGTFVVRQIPAKGDIFVKPFGNEKLKYDVKDISVVDSTRDSMVLRTKVRANNPTDYAAHIPHVNVSIWCNGTKLGNAWGAFDIAPGKNDIVAYASWHNSSTGRELLSQYISGRNVSFTIRTHEGSIPGLPNSNLKIDVPLPHVFGKFLRETTMHIFSSTATFILHSPLPMSITNISASAFYNNTQIGNISYVYPFNVIVGDTETPRLPVDWNTNGGFGLIRDALGGTLKLDARANVSVKIGNWQQSIWYEAKGLGARIRI